jgi:hypothetical protein
MSQIILLYRPTGKTLSIIKTGHIGKNSETHQNNKICTGSGSSGGLAQ